MSGTPRRPGRRAWRGWCVALCLSACATSPTPRTPTQRYYDALDKRLAGDSRGWFDGLVALAHEAPDSRAGRRARSMLQGTDVTTLTMLGSLAAIAIPSFAKYQGRAQQSEVQTQLRGIEVAEEAYRQRHGQWCPTVGDCRLGDFKGTRYIYFLTDSTIRGGDLADDKASLITRARMALRALGMEARMGPEGFLVIAVADLDDDDDLDIWSIDEAGGPFQLARDLDTSGPAPFGL